MNPLEGDRRYEDTRYDDRYRTDHDMEYLNEVCLIFLYRKFRD
jgi:hypothetical protein